MKAEDANVSSRVAKTPGPQRRLSMAGLDEALGFRLRLLEQYILRNFALHMDPLKISPTLYSILMLIQANPKCRQAELAQALGMHQPNLVERVGLLIDRGLVAREEDPADRRANVLELTFAGEHFMEKVAQAHDRHLTDLHDQLGQRYEALLALCAPTHEADPVEA
ncbi:MAG: MarR family transcriptional regulator [Caulobacter sp.]